MTTSHSDPDHEPDNILCACPTCINEGWASQMSPDYDYKCHDCGLSFEEGEARNASLCPDEHNTACPSCGSDSIEELKKDVKTKG